MSCYEAGFNEVMAAAGLGMEKAASAWAKYLRDSTKPAESRWGMLNSMFRSHGVRPPDERSISRLNDSDVVDGWIRSARIYRDVDLPPSVARGSDLWRAAMKDIRDKNFQPMETGLGERHVEGILRYGPSTPGAGRISPNMRREPGWEDAFYDTRDALPRRTHRAEIQHLDTAADSGLFAAERGTQRTRDYAERASGGVRGGDRPTRLSFDMPKALAQDSGEQEYRIPREMFVNWARNHKTDLL